MQKYDNKLKKIKIPKMLKNIGDTMGIIEDQQQNIAQNKSSSPSKNKQLQNEYEYQPLSEYRKIRCKAIRLPIAINCNPNIQKQTEQQLISSQDFNSFDQTMRYQQFSKIAFNTDLTTGQHHDYFEEIREDLNRNLITVGQTRLRQSSSLVEFVERAFDKVLRQLSQTTFKEALYFNNEQCLTQQEQKKLEIFVNNFNQYNLMKEAFIEHAKETHKKLQYQMYQMQNCFDNNYKSLLKIEEFKQQIYEVDPYLKQYFVNEYFDDISIYGFNHQLFKQSKWPNSINNTQIMQRYNKIQSIDIQIAKNLEKQLFMLQEPFRSDYRQIMLLVEGVIRQMQFNPIQNIVKSELHKDKKDKEFTANSSVESYVSFNSSFLKEFNIKNEKQTQITSSAVFSMPMINSNDDVIAQFLDKMFKKQFVTQQDGTKTHKYIFSQECFIPFYPNAKELLASPLDVARNQVRKLSICDYYINSNCIGYFEQFNDYYSNNLLKLYCFNEIVYEQYVKEDDILIAFATYDNNTVKYVPNITHMQQLSQRKEPIDYKYLFQNLQLTQMKQQNNILQQLQKESDDLHSYKDDQQSDEDSNSSTQQNFMVIEDTEDESQVINFNDLFTEQNKSSTISIKLLKYDFKLLFDSIVKKEFNGQINLNFAFYTNIQVLKINNYSKVMKQFERFSQQINKLFKEDFCKFFGIQMDLTMYNAVASNAEQQFSHHQNNYLNKLIKQVNLQKQSKNTIQQKNLTKPQLHDFYTSDELYGKIKVQTEVFQYLLNNIIVDQLQNLYIYICNDILYPYYSSFLKAIAQEYFSIYAISEILVQLCIQYDLAPRVQRIDNFSKFITRFEKLLENLFTTFKQVVPIRCMMLKEQNLKNTEIMQAYACETQCLILLEKVKQLYNQLYTKQPKAVNNIIKFLKEDGQIYGWSYSYVLANLCYE